MVLVVSENWKVTSNPQDVANVKPSGMVWNNEFCLGIWLRITSPYFIANITPLGLAVFEKILDHLIHIYEEIQPLWRDYFDLKGMIWKKNLVEGTYSMLFSKYQTHVPCCSNEILKLFTLNISEEQFTPISRSILTQEHDMNKLPEDQLTLLHNRHLASRSCVFRTEMFYFTIYI